MISASSSRLFFFREAIFILIAGLAAVLITYIRFDTLSLPYYWDEAWVYAPALKHMSLSPGLLPSNLADEYSRGHPLLFHFTGALWIKIFGGSQVSLHSFALSITLVFLFSLFYTGRKLVSPMFGLLFMLAVAVQDMLLAQATMVLPEIFLALFTLWSFYFFVRKRKWLYVLSATFLVLVKEQGAILVAALWLWGFFQLVVPKGLKGIFEKKSLVHLLVLSLPLFALLLFLCVQKIQRGYFLFPTHMDMIQFDADYIVYHLRYCLRILFMQTGRSVWTGVFLFALILLNKKELLWKRLFIGLLILTACKVGYGVWELPYWISGPLVVAIVIYLIYLLQVKNLRKNDKEDPRGPIPIFLVLYVLFCSFNFFCDRYLTCVLPLILFYFLWELFSAFKNEGVIMATLTGALVFFTGYKTFTDDKRHECNVYYTNAIKSQQDLIGYAEQNNLYTKPMLVSFVMVSAMTKPELGFLSGPKVFERVSGMMTRETSVPEYIFRTNFEITVHGDSLEKTGNYKIVKKFTNGIYYGEVLRRKN
jgi:hypothetical protein